jgi:co-chaperonin GroES (HSP10)
VVAVGRGRQVQQGLQQALDVGRLEQVLAADHVGDALQGVVSTTAR